MRFRKLVIVLLLVLLGGLGLGVLVLPPFLVAALVRHWREPTSLVVPVEGLARANLVSTFHAPRDGGRRLHQGADLFAPRGRRVLSASHGTVLKVGDDRLGGRVVTVLGDGPAVYYYAHLDQWAQGLRPGHRVLPGTLLGYVGNTGNARTTPPHLHFGVYRLGWAGVRATDPVPWLKRLGR